MTDTISQCLVMAYVTDTPSQQLESYIILTLADVGRRPDSYLFHTSADVLRHTNTSTSHGAPERLTLHAEKQLESSLADTFAA